MHLIKYIKNFFFCLRYPFWASRNAFGGKKIKRYYKYTDYDCIPEGWRKVFGKQLSEDLRKVLKKNKQLHKFYFDQVKEKYGTLRLYGNFSSQEIDEVLDYYELLSMCYCIFCGKPVRYITKGWITYVCEDCARKDIKPEFLEDCRVTKQDIPRISKWDQDTQNFVELKLGIDFREKWGLK